MEKILRKEYVNFQTFYTDGYNLAQEIKELTVGQTALQRVAYARTYLDKSVLNCCIDIAQLAENVVCELNSTTPILKFSIDNMVKNCITHSDVCYEDYCKIPEIAKNPSKIIKSRNGYDVMLFKEKEKYYKLVIKTTKNRNENYIKSFHLLQQKRYNQY